jgi:Spy/CpxP family protein refolding chaperone
MNRRNMVLLPGVALAATAIAQAQNSTPSATRGPSHKAISNYSGAKSYYYLPRSAAKQTKFITFLTAYLSLTTTQNAQAAAIFANASASAATVHSSIKTAKEALAVAVKYNDGASITQVTASIGSLIAQRHSLGASANAALYQVLTAQQQTMLNTFRG